MVVSIAALSISSGEGLKLESVALRILLLKFTTERFDSTNGFF